MPLKCASFITGWTSTRGRKVALFMGSTIEERKNMLDMLYIPQSCSRRHWPSHGVLSTAASSSAVFKSEPQEDYELNERYSISSRKAKPVICQDSGGVDQTVRRPETEGTPHPVTRTPENLRMAAPTSTRHRNARLGAGGRPWTTLHAKLQQMLTSSKLLDSHSVLVAVSGGQDSVCLLQALVDLRPLWRWRLGVVHCDHGWREDSAANADFVREMAEGRFGLSCYVRTALPGAVPNERSAREWRYSVFAEVAIAHGYDLVVTGHTATDRAETMLLNLLRGSGPDGLVALARSRNLVVHAPTSLPSEPSTAGGRMSDSHNDLGGAPLCSSRNGGECERPPTHVGVRVARPLLEFSRSETQEFVELLELPYFHDTTNDCNDLRRNRLRNEVMPALRQNFNPRLDQALFRFVEVLSAEMDYLAHVTDELYDTVASYSAEAAVHDADVEDSFEFCSSNSGRSQETGTASEVREAMGSCRRSGEVLELEALRRLPLAMQRRVVRKWLETAMNDRSQGRLRRCVEGGGLAEDLELSKRNGCGDVAPSAVRYEDVARCLALLYAPNRTNSDSLCGGMVASVQNGQFVLMTTGKRSKAQLRLQQAQERVTGAKSSKPL